MNSATTIIARAVAEAPDACLAGRGPELLMSVHAAVALDAAEKFFLREAAVANSFAETSARAESLIDAHVNAILQTYAEHGLMDRALFAKAVDAVFGAFHERLTQIAAATPWPDAGRSETFS